MSASHIAEKKLHGTSLKVDVKIGATKALSQLLEPLTGFAFDSGISVREFHAILRAAAVRSVAARQLEALRRVNISGIAASTGMSRAEISKILRSEPRSSSEKDFNRYQQSTNKILSAWQQDPNFNTVNGQPAELKIYGRGSTFESLVKVYGKGIPTRAMLDELIRIEAIEIRPTQTIRLKTGMAVEKGMTPQIIKAFGDRVSELIHVLLGNMRNTKNSAFVATLANVKVAGTQIPLLRRDISVKSAEFLEEVQDLLSRGPTNGRLPQLRNTPYVTVTILYHEEWPKSNRKKHAIVQRRNFRRSEGEIED